jgi:hypothetical protein
LELNIKNLDVEKLAAEVGETEAIRETLLEREESLAL